MFLPGIAAESIVNTRIILHSVAAAEADFKCIIISSPDTYVLVLLIRHLKHIGAEQIFYHTGHGDKA